MTPDTRDPAPIQLYEGCFGITRGGDGVPQEVVGPMEATGVHPWCFMARNQTYRDKGMWSITDKCHTPNDIIAVFPDRASAEAALALDPAKPVQPGAPDGDALAEAWCQPMDCGKHTPRVFLIRFEDTEVGDLTFTDEGEARDMFVKLNQNWNCYLMASLPEVPRPAEPALAAQVDVAQAALDVLAERARQMQVEGWHPSHDDMHTDCELARAAGVYALCTTPDQLTVLGVHVWPWHWTWFKPTTYRRNLVKAGALILAEIERLDRIAAAQEGRT